MGVCVCARAQASFPDNGPSVLEFAVVRSPLFFRETDPQPRKHTIWHAASDFTCGEVRKRVGRI